MFSSETSSSTINASENSSSSGYESSSNCEGSKNSHITKSSWSNMSQNGSIFGCIVHEEGHIYSLAAKSDVLYTGSDSKNIRVWKNMQELSAFKSNSGLVKSIIISGDKIFTGHQDGKVRVWKANQTNPSVHRRSGTLPTFTDIIKSSIRPKNYVEVKRNRSTLWMKHCDAISSLSICEEHGLLYSASWDWTIKVWRIENSKCLESIRAHDDAVNSVVSTVEGVVYSGSADGTVKVWKRETKSKKIEHVFVDTVLKQDSAVTALAVNKTGKFVYCGASDGVVHFFDKLLKGGVLKGHRLAVLCLSVAGNLVFSGSADKNICVWRRDGRVEHSCLGVLRGHCGPVKCLAVEEKDSEQGKEGDFVVYSGSLDKSVRVWNVSDLQGGGGDGNASWDTLSLSMFNR